MAFSPIAFIAPNYSDYGTYWLKVYSPGTTAPKLLAIDSAATTTFSKLQLNVNGFFKSAGGALVTPYVEGAYDGYLFETEAKANSNSTAEAVRIADNITPALPPGSLPIELTTLNLISSTAIYASNAIINTSGYTTSGDGGKARWKQNGVTAQASSQSPAQLGSSLLNDGNGDQWALIVSNKLNTKALGCIHDGATNNTLAFRACILSPHRHIDITDGDLLVTPESTTSDPLFLSSVIGRTLTGVGTLTANAQIKRLIRFTGAGSRASINVDGNNNIGYAVMMNCANPVVRKCDIKNLNGFNNWGAVAIRIEHIGINSKFIVKNNIVETCFGVGDGSGGNGIGMCRAVLAESDANILQRSTISNNEFYDIKGEEGDAIVIISTDGAGTYYDYPCDIKNNIVDGFTRRAVKVQANRADVIVNTISNNLTVASGQEQRAIDIVQGGNLTVGYNTLINCKFMGQIALFKDASTIDSHVNIIGNTISGVGAETTNALIAVKFMDDVVIFGNKIDCPNYAGSAYFLRNINRIYFQQLVTVTNGIIFDKLDLTGINYRASATQNEALVVSVNGFTNRSLQLHNADPSLNDGELISAIEFHQNDNESDVVTASMVARARGSVGATDLEWYTGNPTTAANVLGMKLDQNGNLSLQRNGTTVSLKDSAGTSYALSVDTSGRLLIGGVIVGTQT
jgi:hypothetical protein